MKLHSIDGGCMKKLKRPVLIMGLVVLSIFLFPGSLSWAAGSEKIDLSSNTATFQYTHSDHECRDYLNSSSPNRYSTKCRTTRGAFRRIWVKGIDLPGANKIRIKANLELNDHARLFGEGCGRGVKYDNYVALAALSGDPRPRLRAECNRIATPNTWPKCAILFDKPEVLGYCGVPRCSTSAKCDFRVDASALKRIYLAFQVKDAWDFADVEGILSNLQISWAGIRLKLSEGISSIQCYAEDRTDGSIGSIGTFPDCSFDDTAGGSNKTDGIWKGTVEIKENKLCLGASGIRAPGSPGHRLAIGFTVKLTDKVFEDESNKKNLILKEYTGNPGGVSSGPQCFKIKESASEERSYLLDSFRKHYDISKFLHPEKDKLVPRSAYYRGLSSFYKKQAVSIDLPVRKLGRAVKVLDAMKAMAISTANVDLPGLAFALGDFFEQLSIIPNSGPVANHLIYAYSIGSLVESIAEKVEYVPEGTFSPLTHFPNNKIARAISNRQTAFGQRLIPDKAAKNQLFLIGIADFVISKTLMSDVKAEFNYSMVDYSQKIQLSILARELSILYRKAEARNLSEKEAVGLMIMERDFWIRVIAKNKNHITHEETQGFFTRYWNAPVEYALSAIGYQDSVSAAEGIIKFAEGKRNSVQKEIDEVFGVGIP